MDHNGQRIPAWKRLGLKLKNGQSGVQQDQHQDEAGEHQHGKPHFERKGDSVVDHHAPVPVKESAPGLGKRKHPAEDDGQTMRKSRRTQDNEDSYQQAGQTTPNITLPNQGVVAAPSSAAASDKPRPKGDPNYRKKKGRKSDQNSDWKKPSSVVSAGQPASARNFHERPRTPSLSPGQLDFASEGGATLLVSTETDLPASPTGIPHKTAQRLAPKGDAKSASSSVSPRVDRRKSVTFTPDTKTVDGNSASNLFKKWAQEQKGTGADFSQSEVAQFIPPPKSHPANDIPAAKSESGKADKKTRKAEKKAKKSATADPSGTSDSKLKTPDEVTHKTAPGSEQAAAPAASAGKKKDTSRYTDYLTQYHNDRPNWKFNKAKQNDVLENALNIFRIPDTYSEALIAYVKGLQGAGVIERLKQRCTTAVEEIDAEMSTMDDAEVRKAAEEEALQERLSRERKRRRLEGDIENMVGHPFSEGYVRRLKKGRAQALLTALNLAAPVSAPAKPRPNGLSKKFSPEPTKPSEPRRDSQKRKRRLDVSSDESSDSSSSDSSSDSSSSSSEDSDDADADSDSDSDSESTPSGPDNGKDAASDQSNSDGGSDSASDSSSSDRSDGDSDSDS